MRLPTSKHQQNLLPTIQAKHTTATIIPSGSLFSLKSRAADEHFVVFRGFFFRLLSAKKSFLTHNHTNLQGKCISIVNPLVFYSKTSFSIKQYF